MRGGIHPSAAQEYDDAVIVETESAEAENIETAVTKESDTETQEKSDPAETEMQDFEINEISVYSDDTEGDAAAENYTNADSYGLDVLTDGEKTVTYPITGNYDAINWSLDENGTLTISGTGALEWNWDAISDISCVKKIVINEGITELKERSFHNFASLTSIEIPDSVSSIGEYAFYSCNSLKSITIPKKVTSIEEGTFYNCRELTSIEIPDSVTSIGKMAFGVCTKLESITIPKKVTSIGEWAFLNCIELKSIAIPDGVTSIEQRTFINCSKLSSVSIPDSVTSIGESAFCYCYSLQSITIPKGVTSIAADAFYGCVQLSAIRIPKSVSAIDDEAFDRSGIQTVYGDAGSYAETYAQSKGYLFVDLSQAEDQIRNLPELTELTLEKKSDVAAARSEYDKLSDEAKKFVEASLLQQLTAAETKIQELEAEVKSAEEIKEVNDVIAALPNGVQVTLENRNAIEAARKAYEALTQEQKQKISADVLQQLTAAETKIQELEAAAQHVHAYSTWKTSSKATVFAAEVQKRTCACGAAETRNFGKKLTAVLELPGKLKSLQIKKGDTKTFALTMANGDSVKSVKSSADKVLKATLDKNGKITLKAIKTGTAKLTIKLASRESRTYTVKVTGGTVKTTAVSVTNVANKKLTLAKGNTYSLKTTVKPFTSTQKPIYKSSNKKVATVTSSGKIKAVAPGKATITVKSGSKSVKIAVTVPGIANVKSSVTVKKNKTLTLNPKLYGINGKVTYISSNTKTATVNSKGKIKGIKKGTAKITVQAGSYSRTVTVKVK